MEKSVQIKIPDGSGNHRPLRHHGRTSALGEGPVQSLVDIFLRVTAYSLQTNPFVPRCRESVRSRSTSCTSRFRNTGQQFIVPVQAKGGNDQISAAQVAQDLSFADDVFHLSRRGWLQCSSRLSDVVVMFELAFQDDDLKLVDEKQYVLVPACQVTDDDLSTMARSSD